MNDGEKSSRSDSEGPVLKWRKLLSWKKYVKTGTADQGLILLILEFK